MAMERYLYLYRAGTPETTLPPTEDQVTRAGALIHEMTMAGVLLAIEGCLPTRFGARIQMDQGELRVVEGPFTDVKQLVSGVLLLQTKSKADAIHWGKRLLTIVGEGSVELRLLADVV
jgi:hypothetical protein